MATKKTTRSRTPTKKPRSHMETSKRIVLMTGLFAGIQIQETMALVVIFPQAASTLLTICLSCITGYITVLSWYFGKALGENRLKITQGLSSFHEALADITASHKPNKSREVSEEDEEEIEDEIESEG